MATTVVVPSVWPVGSQVSITGQVTSGGAVVGGVLGNSFGTPVIKLANSIPFGGVPSVAAFGAILIVRGGSQSVQVGAVASAASIGVPKLSATIRPAGGVPSAGAFGTVGFHTAITIQVPGVPSPQGVFVPSITGQVIAGDGHVVGGYWTGLGFGFVMIHATITVPVGGVPSAAAFGSNIQIVQTVHPPGVPSAGDFGWRLGWIIMGPGVPSAAAFGTAAGGFAVFIDWLHDLECIDVDLDESTCTDLVLTPSTCIDLDLDVLVPT